MKDDSLSLATTSTRLRFLDMMRLVLIVFVIILHAAMTYMEPALSWWYVKDSENHILFTVLVVWIDSFPIWALFFLAGYFAPASLQKKGQKAYLKGKIRHVGLPWLLGAYLAGPFFAAATMKAVGVSASTLKEFVLVHYFGPFFQQGAYWFLGVLLFFLMIQSFFKVSQSDEPGSELLKTEIVGLWLVGSLCYWISSQWITGADEWVSIGYVLYFQPARIVAYICAFILGIIGWRRHWFTINGWKPTPSTWISAALICSAALLFWQFMLAHSLTATLNAPIQAVLYNAAAISLTFALISLFFLLENRVKPKSISDRITNASYGIYWLHMPVLMAILSLLCLIPGIAVVKCTIAVVLTFYVCLMLTLYGLQKIPLFRNVF